MIIFWKSTIYLHIQNRLLFRFLKSADCLHFQSQLIVYIFKISWLLTFSKSADYLHFQSLLFIIFSSLLIIYIFKSAECLHFQSQLMALSNIFFNVLLFTFNKKYQEIALWHKIENMTWNDAIFDWRRDRTRTRNQILRSALARSRLKSTYTMYIFLTPRPLSCQTSGVITSFSRLFNNSAPWGFFKFPQNEA